MVGRAIESASIVCVLCCFWLESRKHHNWATWFSSYSQNSQFSTYLSKWLIYNSMGTAEPATIGFWLLLLLLLFTKSFTRIDFFFFFVNRCLSSWWWLKVVSAHHKAIDLHRNNFKYGMAIDTSFDIFDFWVKPHAR